MSSLDLSIVLPTKNRTPILLKTLDALLKATAQISCEIFIIDNAPDDQIINTQHITLPTHVQILKNPGNRNSVFASRNYGASLTQSELLLFIDDDIICNQSSIDFVIDYHKNNKNKALNVHWTYPPKTLEQMRQTFFGRFLIQGRFSRMQDLFDAHIWQENSTFESNEVASYFLSVHKKDFNKVKGYNADLLHEGTDLDIIYRFRNAGIQMFINTTEIVYHNEEDRLDTYLWLKRKERLGEITAHAQEKLQGDSESFRYSFIKHILFNAIFALHKPILACIKILPGNLRLLDRFIFKIYHMLTGAFMHHGYMRKNA